MGEYLRIAVVLVLVLFCPAVMRGEGSSGAKVEGVVSLSGTLDLKSGRRELCRFNIGAFDKGWQQVGATLVQKNAASGGEGSRGDCREP